MKIFVALMLISNMAMASEGEVLHFEFLDAAGSKYHTGTLADDLIRYNWEPEEIKALKILLIETPALDDAGYRKQIAVLDSFVHHDDIYAFFVIACPKEEDSSGYHTSKEVAQTLIGGKTRFRVRLLDLTGTIIHQSLEPITEQTLKKWLQ